MTLGLKKCLDDYTIEICKVEGIGTARVGYAATRLIEFFGPERDVATMKRKDGRDYRSHRWKVGVSDSTIRRELGVLLRAAGHAVDEERLDAVPSIKLPPESQPRERWFTEAEVLRILEQPMSEDCRLLFYIGLFTGARLGAILNLTYPRVDWEHGFIDFCVPGERITRKRKVKIKMAAELRVPLRVRYEATLADPNARRVPKGPEKGAQYVIRKPTVGREVKRVLRAAGIDEPGVNVHALRRTFVTWSLLNGADLASVSAATGDNVSTLQKSYLKLFPQHTANAVNAIHLSTEDAA